MKPFKRFFSRELKEINFYYNGIDCDYHTRFSCSSSGCNEEGICRCGEIVDTQIIDFNLITVIGTIIADLRIDDPVVRFAVERYIRKHVTEDSFEIEVTGGYYGDEIDGIYLRDSQFEWFLQHTRKEILEAALIDEYGILLPKLKDCEYQGISVPIDDIITPSKKQEKAADDGSYLKEIRYLTPLIPIALCFQKGKKYTVIDGYHRIAAARKAKLKTIHILVATPKPKK